MLAEPEFITDGKQKMSWELQGQVMLTSDQGTVDNMLRRRLTGRKPHWNKGNLHCNKEILVCVYVHKEELESMFASDSANPLLSLLFFFTMKSFFNSCSGPLDLFYTLSLKLV